MQTSPNEASKPVNSVPSAKRNLLLRILSAALLAPFAIAIAVFGGWPFVIFWAFAALAVWWEWTRLVAPEERTALLIGICAIALSGFFAGAGLSVYAVVTAFAGGVVAALASSQQKIWMGAGVVYAAAIVVASTLLRQNADAWPILFLFAVVWATDIFAYFTGRAIGGPKLAPSISPGKTWSGAIGGTLCAVVAGLLVLQPSTGSIAVKLALAACSLSAISQVGDLFESRMKRHFNAKDSGALIPGHGGVMDRLDGYVAAAALAAIIGVIRAGWHAPGQGLIGW